MHNVSSRSSQELFVAFLLQVNIRVVLYTPPQEIILMLISWSTMSFPPNMSYAQMYPAYEIADVTFRLASDFLFLKENEN